MNIDDITDLARPAHTILLGAGIPICEHMTNLAALPAQGGRLHAVPIAWQGGATFPVRAYVQLSAADPSSGVRPARLSLADSDHQRIDPRLAQLAARVFQLSAGS